MTELICPKCQSDNINKYFGEGEYDEIMKQMEEVNYIGKYKYFECVDCKHRWDNPEYPRTVRIAKLIDKAWKSALLENTNPV